MEVKYYIRTLRKYIGWILLFMIAAGGGTAIVSYNFIPPTYEASVKLLIHSTNASNMVDLTSINANMKLMDTYQEVIQTSAILTKVSERISGLQADPEMLSKALKVRHSAGSQIMTLTIRGNDYREAAELANAIAEVFQSEVTKLLKVNNVTILGKADPRQISTPVLPNHQLYILVSVLVAALLSIGFAFLHSVFDDTIKTAEDVDEVIGLVVLAVLPEIEKKDRLLKNKSAADRKVGEIPYATTKQ
ncbi:Capsular polysaccharide biosynthesis protein [Paenibacillus tianmuensis]|uniref:Capsular polysaccharide biosynthesis protein n=1 Tax=Paenibacillus tianmuensis TaxID=624147 RepID=A0A1G4R630_9BACL|nr:Wzz/FepE/Etk N-terminal domain-containing protein [Paenibacillus tianmuensis]SCW52228.1 Capsular polysaccharide biosynthesis protein [Paenibacillus tianmuensis]